MSAEPRILLVESNPADWLGRRSDLTLSDYHRTAPGVSKSDLDNAHRSIAHYLAAKGEIQRQTPAMAFGEAFHCRVLTPAVFEATYIVAPDFDRRTVAGRQGAAAFEAASKGKTLVADAWMAQIDSMVDSLMSHPIAGQLFAGGEAEQSFFWIDERTGLLCKCRPDYLRADGIVVDLKTAADASLSGFTRAVANYRYHVQDAFYRDGIKATIGVDLDAFLFVAIEKDPPYAVAVYTLDKFGREAGRSGYREDLDRIAAHVAAPGAYAGYPDEVQEIQLPPWAD